MLTSTHGTCHPPVVGLTCPKLSMVAISVDVSSCCGVCMLGEKCHTSRHRTSLLGGAEVHSGKDWYNEGSCVCK